MGSTSTLYVLFSMDGPTIEVKLSNTNMSVDNQTEVIELEQEQSQINVTNRSKAQHKKV